MSSNDKYRWVAKLYTGNDIMAAIIDCNQLIYDYFKKIDFEKNINMTEFAASVYSIIINNKHKHKHS